MVDWNNTYIDLLKRGNQREVFEFSMKHHITDFAGFDYDYLFKTLTTLPERNGFIDNFIGILYLNGKGCTRDESLARTYFEYASERGCQQGYINLGVLHYGEEDYEKAFEYFNKMATEHNNPYAYNHLAAMYFNGLYVEKNEELHAENLAKSCQAGLSRNYVKYAQYLLTKKKYDEGFRYLVLAEKAGDKSAYFGLAVCHAHGLGTEKDLDLAIDYFDLIENKNEAAYLEMGSVFTVKLDFDRAFACFRQAGERGQEKIKLVKSIIEIAKYDYFKELADAGNSDAQYELGKFLSEKPAAKEECKNYLLMSKNPEALFLYGKISYDEGNYATALEYLIKALEKGVERSKVLLGVMYAKGEGVPKDCAKAYDLWSQLDKKRYPQILLNIGTMYHNGDHFPRDLVTAMNYYQEAVAAGYELAHNNIGLIYYREYKDIELAVEHLEKSAALDTPESYYLLAEIYCTHPELKKEDKVIEYLQFAANKGLEIAFKMLEKLEKLGEMEGMEEVAAVGE